MFKHEKEKMNVDENKRYKRWMWITIKDTNVSSETKIHWARLTKNRKLQRKKISKLENSNINYKHKKKIKNDNSDLHDNHKWSYIFAIGAQKEGSWKKFEKFWYLKNIDSQKYVGINIPTNKKLYAVYNNSTLNMIIYVTRKRKKKYITCKH